MCIAVATDAVAVAGAVVVLFSHESRNLSSAASRAHFSKGKVAQPALWEQCFWSGGCARMTDASPMLALLFLCRALNAKRLTAFDEASFCHSRSMIYTVLYGR